MFELTRRNNNGNLSSYNPFREMEELEKAFFGYPFWDFMKNSDLTTFNTDITDDGNNYLLEADLPGFSKEDIQIDLNENILTIHAKRHSKAEEKDKNNKVIRTERSYGSFSRQFDISGIDTQNIKAKYENGVLKLTLPKKEEVIPETKQLRIE